MQRESFPVISSVEKLLGDFSVGVYRGIGINY